MIVLLDSGPLSRLIHPRPGVHGPITEWLTALRARRSAVRVPEIIDYEVRRDLIRQGRIRSIVRLNRFIDQNGTVPVTRAAMREAARYWGLSRRGGRQTAPDNDIDIDMILAATATPLDAGEPAVVATENVRHLELFCDARPWPEID